MQTSPGSTQTEAAARQLFSELKPGDRVEIVHAVTVGSQRWKTVTQGTVVNTERRQQGLHFRRQPDDKVFADLVILKRDDGELTTVSMDEFTRLRRL
jgi:hypothetical protein